MNTNIILDGFNAILKQLIASAVADAVKPLQERIAVLEAGEWTKTQHIVAKEIQPLQDRDVLDGGGYVKRNEVVDLVDTVVGNAIEAYDFNDILDWDNKIEEGINNYDFSDIIQESISGAVDEDRVQEMIDETIDACTIRRG